MVKSGVYTKDTVSSAAHTQSTPKLYFSAFNSFRISDSFSPATALPLLQSTVCRGVSHFNPPKIHLSHGSYPMTHQRSQKVVLVLLKLLQRIPIVPRALDDLRGPVLADVRQDRLHLVDGGRVLGDVELKRVAADRAVRGGVRLGACGRLLQQVGDSDRGRRAGLVEEGDDVERLALWAAIVSKRLLRMPTSSVTYEEHSGQILCRLLGGSGAVSDENCGGVLYGG